MSHGLDLLHQFSGEESPGESVVQATIQLFTDKLKASKPSMAEGFTKAAVESVLPADIVVQACCRRIIRAVEAVSEAKQVHAAPHAGAARLSAGGLANLLAPVKSADVASLLNKASLKGLAFSVQAEQGLWSAMQSHTDEAQVATGTPSFSLI